MVTQTEESWVLLSYRIPREPSTPRIAVWRKLKELGVAQIGDGLVGLPFDSRTKEHLELLAAKVIEADGEAIVWSATPGGHRDHARLKRELTEARTAEYLALLRDIETTAIDARSIASWRRRWRKIDRRDYFHAPKRDEARLAISDKARELESVRP